MPCEIYKSGESTFIVKRARARGKKWCKFCRSTYKAEDGRACDFPIDHGKTCDAEMCSGCAVRIGTQNTPIGMTSMVKVGDSVDVCPIHDGKEWPK